MSKTQNLLFGRMSGKIGGLVTSTWKGINVVKGKPLTVANPKTDAQIQIRSAMTQTVAIARQTLGAIDIGYAEQAVGKSPYNAFTSNTIKSSFDYGILPIASLVPLGVKMSKGTIATMETSVDTIVGGTQTLTLDWVSTPLQPGQSASDKLVVVIYNETEDTWFQAFPAVIRSAATAVIVFPATSFSAAQTIDVYSFFYNPTTRKSSDSFYEQTTT
jgi:predicted metalloprotease